MHLHPPPDTPARRATSTRPVAGAGRERDQAGRQGRLNILLASPVAPEAIDALRMAHDVVTAFDQPDALPELLGDCNVIIVRSGVQLAADMLRRAPSLQLIVRAGSGLDNIALDYARDHGVRVVRVPGPSAQAVAELTFGLILALSRKIAYADALIRQGHWPKPQLGGLLLHGKVLGVVGAGRIGARVGELGAAWGMRSIGCVKANDMSSKVALLAHKNIELRDFATVVLEGDIVSIHTPLDSSTRGMIDDTVIAKMKPGALLINTSRGGVVDEAALLEALRDGHLGGAALDVHECEGEGIIPALSEFDNVVMTPHIGGMAVESQSIIGRRVIELIDAHISGSLDATATPDEHVL
jgi:D-3-phosphoglycerate dehydrogenase